MKILLAVDDSPYANEVVSYVARHKWPEKTQFKILTVLQPLSLEDVGKDYSELLAEVSERRQSWAEEHCQQLCEQLHKAMPGVAVDPDIRQGSPAAEISNAALEWSADKIFLGAHSRGICPHNLAGSVSRAVACHAPCSVEIIRSKPLGAKSIAEQRKRVDPRK